MLEVQAVLALLTCGLGDADEVRLRLGALVRRLDGSPEQKAALLRDRNNATSVIDLEALL